MTHKLWLLAGAAVLSLAACDQPAATTPAAPVTTPAAPAFDVEAERAAFDALIDQLTTEIFTASPEFATYLGVDEEIAGGPYLNRLDDYSVAGRARMRALIESAAARLEAADADALDEDRRVTRSVLLERARASLAAAEAAGFYGSASFGGFTVYPVTQLSGLHISVPNLMESQQPVTNTDEALAYVQRLYAFEQAFDDQIAALREDAAVGLVPPDFVIDKTLAVLARFTEPAPTENVLYTSLKRKLEAADVPDASARLEAAEAAISDAVYPAYAHLAAVLQEIRPGAVHDAGISARPNGEAVYDAMIRVNADSDLSADEIHQIGLGEVDRITAQMEAILTAQGYASGTIGERMSALQAEPRFLYPNTDAGKAQLIADLNVQVADVMAKAPEWFATLPPQPVEVRRVPAFSEESAPGGYYDLPSLDGSRPGIYWINLRDTANNPIWGLKTLTYHEAVPGHHFQLSLSLDQADVPLLRKLVAGTNAYVEGWALYSERLAEEMGMYEDDPFGDLGRLQSELFRAVRLVVDTGMHAKGWSREQAIDYMVSTGASERADAVSEIERYAAWPGQALGYKMGMLKILELRAKAKAELGPDFDIREFHDAVLLDGGLPLPVMETRVEAWIAAKKAG